MPRRLQDLFDRHGREENGSDASFEDPDSKGCWIEVNVVQTACIKGWLLHKVFLRVLKIHASKPDDWHWGVDSVETLVEQNVVDQGAWEGWVETIQKEGQGEKDVLVHNVKGGKGIPTVVLSAVHE